MATLVGQASDGAVAFKGCHRHPNRTPSSNRVLATNRICRPSFAQLFLGSREIMPTREFPDLSSRRPLASAETRYR